MSYTRKTTDTQRKTGLSDLIRRMNEIEPSRVVDQLASAERQYPELVTTFRLAMARDVLQAALASDYGGSAGAQPSMAMNSSLTAVAIETVDHAVDLQLADPYANLCHKLNAYYARLHLIEVLGGLLNGEVVLSEPKQVDCGD